MDSGSVRLTETIPALPVRDAAVATAFYRDRLGFAPVHEDTGFAVVRRDDAELHLWQAGDLEWASRADLAARPVHSGAESFLAGTASCRIRVDAGIDDLYREFAGQQVLHYADRGAVRTTEYGSREFAVSDVDNNLLTFFHWPPA